MSFGRRAAMVTAICSLLVSLLTACTQSSNDHDRDHLFELTPDQPSIFSTRSDSTTHAFVVIKLKKSPLLSQERLGPQLKSVRNLRMDPKAAQEITEEQNLFIQELKALSSEIVVVYRYRQVINAVAAVVPVELLEQLGTLGNVATVERTNPIARPKVKRAKVRSVAGASYKDANSVKWIGATELHARGIRGQGLRVGVIDTGVDYTHEMFGGAGTEDAFKAIDPEKPDASFPSGKVIGGIDLVGSRFDSYSADASRHIPKPDSNPIDEEGHGTHVAGTIAGVGDAIETYNGVAPDALLYAIKVFGAGDGSTSDAAVIAGLEYSADPNLDGDFRDRLDVVNVSIGGEFGDPMHLYKEAMANISRIGTAVVCAGGNSGETPYIADAPGVIDDAFSVAASIDNMKHNWQFDAVKFSTHENPEIIVEAYESTASLPVADADGISGSLVYAGVADKDFDEAMKAQLLGKVALIDRGIVNFDDKIRRAQEAGAIGVVVVNNEPGEPFVMDGGPDEFTIPAIMISQVQGTKFKDLLTRGGETSWVKVDFKSEKKYAKPEMIDSIGSFSSSGPRSSDAYIKPEIAAPGEGIVSAKIGGGHLGERMGGTSMAAPHIAGVIALVKQARPDLTVDEIRSLLLSTAKILKDAKGSAYSVTRQGAGRVQVAEAIKSPLLFSQATFSLGQVEVESQVVIKRKLEIQNSSSRSENLKVSFRGSERLRILSPNRLSLRAGEKKTIEFEIAITTKDMLEPSLILDGYVYFSGQHFKAEVKLPILAVAKRTSKIEVSDYKPGHQPQIVLANKGPHAGTVEIFNLIGSDQKKKDAYGDLFKSTQCDLERAGYRIIKRQGQEILQFGVKLYRPLTTWDMCEVSVLIDQDGDGVLDQELVGAKATHLSGLTEVEFTSLLLDSKVARELRQDYEAKVKAGEKDLYEDYTAAVLYRGKFLAESNSAFAVLEVPIDLLALDSMQALRFEIAASYLDNGVVEGDDFLDNFWSLLSSSAASSYRVLPISAQAQAVVDLPEYLELQPGQEASLSFSRGQGLEPLWLVFPQNRSGLVDGSQDSQSVVFPHPPHTKPNYKQP